ncbi:MAG: rRNA maturation RNase YbeY [Bacteroidia bacterium]|nr:rRNA maturation RNase YbeY [Bacteroidia bacterium]
MITYQTDGVEKPKICTRRTSKWIKEIAASHDKKIGEIAYIFCCDEKILQINKEYLKHDYYTDIITFDYTEDDKISGDIFISLDTVKSNSEQFGTDYYEELSRIIIHGILHLCGFKDKEPSAKAQMTDEENKALLAIGPKDIKK